MSRPGCLGVALACGAAAGAWLLLCCQPSPPTSSHPPSKSSGRPPNASGTPPCGSGSPRRRNPRREGAAVRPLTLAALTLAAALALALAGLAALAQACHYVTVEEE